MNFVLLRSSAFIRNARKIVKKQPELAQNMMKCINAIAKDYKADESI